MVGIDREKEELGQIVIIDCKRDYESSGISKRDRRIYVIGPSNIIIY